MFLRKVGRRYHVIHSYRDGRGKVCQWPVRQFLDVESLERQLADWEGLEVELRALLPGSRTDWGRLRAQAEKAVSQGERRSDDRAARARALCRQLRRLLDDEPELVPLVHRALGREAPAAEKLARAENWVRDGQWARAEQALVKLRRRWRPLLPAGRRPLLAERERLALFTRALTLLAEVRRRTGQWAGAAAVCAERARMDPTPEALLDWSEALHRSGRPEQALEAVRRIPATDRRRFYHEAAALLELGRQQEALQPLLRALARDRKPAQQLRRLEKVGSPYWERYGALWGPAARDFLLRVEKELMVRVRLTWLESDGRRVTRLVPRHAQRFLLARLGVG